MERVTLKKINKQLTELGISGELVRGGGYYYMTDREGELFWGLQQSTGIYCYRLNDQNIDDWITDIKNLIGRHIPQACCR